MYCNARSNGHLIYGIPIHKTIDPNIIIDHVSKCLLFQSRLISSFILGRYVARV